MGGARSALEELFRYPLLAAIRDRRSRRVIEGVSIAAGQLSYTSASPPRRLSPLEEAVLIVATGLTGIVCHDGPLDIPGGGGKELGTPFVGFMARAASSPDNSQPTRMFVVNDDGIWLLRRLQGREALAVMRDLPPRWEDWSESDWTGAAALVKQRVSDRRLDFPREYPYYMAWNKQISNRAGSTMFLPIVDTTRMVINGILNLIAEPDHQRPLFIDDFACFHPHNVDDWAGWAAANLGIVPSIPYQPIGGVDMVKSGFVNQDRPLPLGLARAMFADHEAFFLQQNVMLVAQAIGLAAWVHVCPQVPYLFQRDEAKGWHGLGFRTHKPDRHWVRWPPLPANQPNPVGLDGLLEGLCPPYVANMDEAVDRLLEEKRAAYADDAVLARAYRDPSEVGAFRAAAATYTPKMVSYAKAVCRYVHETYDRFPAHVDAFYSPGTWVQVGHAETGYYEKTFDPRLHERQMGHAARWGEG